jgi:hypothetical protein
MGQKAKNRPSGPKISMIVCAFDRKFYMYHALADPNRKNKPSEPEKEIWAPKSVRSWISIDPEYKIRKNIIFGVKKAEVSLQTPKAD